jgi:thiol-disulfide isomerase/thioredoxin
MRRKLLPITLVLGVILSLASVALADGVGSRAPEIGLSDMRGRQMRMSGLRGKVVLVNIWGTWCRLCREEMPFLDRLYQRYRDQGPVVVGVAQDSDRSVVTVTRRARVSIRSSTTATCRRAA